MAKLGIQAAHKKLGVAREDSECIRAVAGCQATFKGLRLVPLRLSS